MRLCASPGTAALLTARRWTFGATDCGAREELFKLRAKIRDEKETQCIPLIVGDGEVDSEALHAYQGRILRKFCAMQ